MICSAYQDWISIYNNEMKLNWQRERSEMKKLAMIYYAFQNELNKLKNELTEEFDDIKVKLRRKDIMQKCQNFNGFADSEHFGELIDYNKENEQPQTLHNEEDNSKTNGEDFFIETPSTEDFAKESSPSSIIFNRTALSPVLNKSLGRIKRKQSTSPCLKMKNKSAKNMKSQTPTLSDSSNIMESSVIAGTPLPKVKKKRVKKAERTKPKRTKTLTQCFLEPKKNKEIDSNLPSMDIDKMIELINESSDNGSDTDATIDLTEIGEQCDKIPDNLASFVQNYDKIPQKKESDPKFAYNEVVRGKARKKLKGWACKECEDYYKNLNLPPDELEKKKDQCSRHRHKFKPLDESYTGFWDLTFKPTPASPSSEKSLVLNYMK